MFSNSKAKKILCGCAAFSMLGPDAGCAKSNNTSVSIQKSKSTTHSAVSKTKSRVQNDELDNDFEYSDNNNDTNTATLKAILPSIYAFKKYAPYALAALPSLGIVTYGSIKKLLESENPLSPAPTPPEEPTPTPIPTPGPTPTQDEKENTSILKVVILSMVVFGIILVIYIYCKCNSEKRPKVVAAPVINLRKLIEFKKNIEGCKNTDTHFNSANPGTKFDQTSNKNNNAEDTYIKLSVKNGTIGRIVWQANNCFIISAICTRFGMERKEPSNVLLNYNLTPMQVAYFLLKMIEKRRKVEGENKRLIWTESEKELKGLLEQNNKKKLERFAIRMWNVLLYDSIAWKQFMKEPSRQYEEENNLFGCKVDGSGNLYGFREENDQGNPVDALDGMGVSYVGGGSGFEYKKSNGDVIKPETSIPFTQILDQNSMYMRITYDGAKRKFILQDYTWDENNPVQKELSCDEIRSGAISFGEGWYIEKDKTMPGDTTETQLKGIAGYIGYEYNCDWYVYLNGNETSSSGQRSFFHMVNGQICLCKNGKDTKLSEEEYEEKLKGEFGIKVQERRDNDEELQVYDENGKYIESFTGLNALNAYKQGYNENDRKKHKLINYGKKSIGVKYKKEFKFPARIKNRKMYIAAVSYTMGDHNSGHCQAYEFKYDKQENCKEGEAKYTTNNCIDRSCFSLPDMVAENKNAYNYLQELLSGKYGINKNIASNFGSVRLISEQVIDEFPVQYRYYESQEELDALKGKEISRNNENSVENKDISMINEILRELKDNNELFKDVNLLKNIPNENHNNSDSLNNSFTLFSNSNDNNQLTTQ